MGDSVPKGFRPFGGHAFQPGIAGNGQPPALVVRQVQMQFVEFVVGHQVRELFQVRQRDEMARRIHHQSAPGVSRLVLDDAAGDALRLCGKLVLKLTEGGLSVQPAFPSSGR